MATPSPTIFGELLQAIMDRNNLTQRELARRAGVDHVALCRILKPSYKFKPGKTIDRLVSFCGCTKLERIRLYQLAQIAPPELVKLFCDDDASGAIAMINYWRLSKERS